jgi:Skp family chaperone for outer membrane proteins
LVLHSAIRVFAGLSVGLSLVFGLSVRAQESSLNIAVVDVQRVLRQSAATKSIRPQLKEIKQSYEAEVRRQEKALRAANQDLLRQRAILAPETYDQRRKSFARQAGEAQRSLQNYKRSIDLALGRARNKVHRALMGIAREIAKERTFNLVLPRSAILVMEKRLDITAEVIKRLNERLPSVAIDLPKVQSDKKK